MTDDQHGEGTPPSGGRWDPLPQGDYDDGATAFVKLPEGGIDALLASADSPLAAPGSYEPPQIAVTPDSAEGTDPAAAGTWAVPADGAQWPDPNAVPQDPGSDRFAYNPGSTQQWNFEEPAGTGGGPAPGHDVTGQWSIPVAGGDLPDESGEFTTSSLVQQWGGTPPATLPGGAPAPWATEAAGQPWGQPQTEEPTAPGDGPGQAHEQPAGTGHAHVPSTEAGQAREHAAESPVDTGRGYERPPTHTGGRPAGHAPEHPGAAAHAPVEPDQAAHEAETARAHTAEQSRPHAPERAADPYAQAPAAAASRPVRGPGETAGAAGAQGAVEAPEGRVEPLAESVADAASGPAVSHAPDSPDTSAGPDSADGPEATDDEAPPPPGEEHPLVSYVLRVNGVERPVSDAWIGESLLYVLRERLGLAGAKDGCSQGECGACNVQVDGRLVASCLVPAVTAAGSEVRTVEGLAVDGQPSDVQRALARCGAVQCGFCVPGMAMTVHDLLEGNPAPTELETRQALCGNLCRCSGYRGVVDAVQEVVAEREAHSEGDASEQDGDGARIPHQAGPGAGGVNPSAFESPGFPVTPGRHDQGYGQDGGQA